MTPMVAGTSMAAMRADEYFGPVVAALEDPEGAKASVAFRAKRFEIRDGGLMFRGEGDDGRVQLRRCVAGARQQMALLREMHAAPAAGHQGVERTMQALAAHFWWPRQAKAVVRFVKNCETCQRVKPGRTEEMPLQPIVTPAQPGQVVSPQWISWNSHGRRRGTTTC